MDNRYQCFHARKILIWIQKIIQGNSQFNHLPSFCYKTYILMLSNSFFVMVLGLCPRDYVLFLSLMNIMSFIRLS